MTDNRTLREQVAEVIAGRVGVGAESVGVTYGDMGGGMRKDDGCIRWEAKQ